MIPNARFVPVVLFLAAAVSACGSDDTATAVPEVGIQETDVVAASGDTSTSGADILARFTSCADVAPAVAPYITGLVESPDNAADEYGVICNWEIDADTATNLADIRSVEVLIEPGTGEVPSMATLEATNFEILRDAAIEKAGGVAFTAPTSTSVIGVIVTTVETPDVKVSIAGGEWADMPALDGPAAVSAAKSLIGI